MNLMMTRILLVSLVVGAVAAGVGMAQAPKKMSFFITSVGPGKGGDLGGLKGADAYCQKLATDAGEKGGTWRAYLSAAAAPGQPAVNARDRIGKGPWFNAKGVQVAANLDDLHSENSKLGKENSLDERGQFVKGRGDTPNQHDIITGSTADGRLAPPVAPPLPANAPAGTPAPAAPANMTCDNWTSSSTGRTMVGHFDRQGGGVAPTSWNAAHMSRSCSQPDLVATGGAGLFYCFRAK